MRNVAVMGKKARRAVARKQSKDSEPPSPPLDTTNSESDSAPDSSLSGLENGQPPSPAPSNASATSHLDKGATDDAIPPNPPAENKHNNSDEPTPGGEDQTSTKATPEKKEESHTAEPPGNKPDSPSTPNPQSATEGGETGKPGKTVAEAQKESSNTPGLGEPAAEHKQEPEKKSQDDSSNTPEQDSTAEPQDTLKKEPTKGSSSTTDSEKTTEESGDPLAKGLSIISGSEDDAEKSAEHDAIEEPRPAAPTPPSSSPQLSEHIQPEPVGALLDELQSASVSPSMATAQVQSVPDTPHHYPRGAPSEHFASPPSTGYHQRYFSQSQPSASPLNYYSMVQPNGYPNGIPYAMPPHHPSPPYQQHYGSFSTPFSPYGTSPPTQRHNSIASRGSNPSESPLGQPGMENASAIEDDPIELFSRVSSAIPHLHLLLSRYKETHGQLGVREELIRKAETQQADMIKRKDDHIDQVKKQLEELKKSHSSEANKLRMEIGNREEHEKELEEQVAKLTGQIAKLEDDKKALEAANEALASQKVILEQEKTDLEKSVTEEKERLSQEFEDWKVKAHETFEADKMALAVEFDKKLKEQETSADMKLKEQEASAENRLKKQEASAKTQLEEQEASAETRLKEQKADAENQLKEQEISAEKQRAQAAEEFSKEKETLRADFQRQKQNLEDSFEKVRKEIETKLTGVQNRLDEALKTEREGREAWEIERENLVKGHQEERDGLRKGWDEQRELMLSEHKSTTDGWSEKHAQATTLADEQRKRADQFEKEKDDLQRRWEEEKRDRESAYNELKTVAENLGTEKGKLEKLIQAFGDVTDIKSKGDAYYLEAFSQLLKQILDLSNTHFTHLPITPPADILSLIPPGIPSFLGDTTSSRELRAAYVAHTISKILTFRVFTPFLFSLGRRFDKADGLFTAMSNQLRGKSTRKEAIWRQHTLVAAFTSSNAKQRINSAAGSVVDEIVNAIKYFTDPSEEDAIRVSMRRIVKLAAETWRFARLEREIIAAKMPAVDDDSKEYKGVDFWPAQTFDSARYALPVNTAVEQFQERPRILLRLFPVIHREAMHECFRFTEKEKEDNGCVYSYGLALYDNAAPLVAREEELRQAGLPRHSNLSSSASDLPPTLSPPRNLLPTVPEPGEDETKRSPPENFAKDTESQRHDSGYPTPPKSRAGTPPSPLFPAIGEIDGLRQPSHHMPSLNRRSTGPPMSRSVSEGARRPSGYISNRSSMDGPGNRMGSRFSRFRSGSHSAAVNGLYDTSMSGGVPMERTGSSLRSNSMRGDRTVSFSRVEGSEENRDGA